MKRIFPLFVILAISLFFFISCYYDNEEFLYPSIGTACDTINVTFSGTVAPILSNSCLSCHSNATAAGFGNNIRLENYTDVQIRAATIAGSIKHQVPYSPMPKNGGKIKACSITQFDIWVRKGMPDN